MPGTATDGPIQMENFFGKKQYDERGVRRYEFIFGETFISPGGAPKNREFVERLNLQPDQFVLDVGCGVGGCCFQMTKEFGVKTYGVDISDAMISVGNKYLVDLPEDIRSKVSLEVGDITKMTFEPETFDVIYSRDALMHIHDKPALFQKFFTWLKPGGILCYTDYCSGERINKGANYLKYLKERNYVLLTFEELRETLSKCGFHDIKTEDISNDLIHILKTELARCVERKKEFLKHFEQSDLEFLANDWNAKRENCEVKDQSWGFIFAVKPKN